MDIMENNSEASGTEPGYQGSPPNGPSIKKSNLLQQLLISGIILAVIVGGGLVLARPPKEQSAAPAAQPQDITVSPTGDSVVNIETAPAQLQVVSSDIQTTGTLSFPADQTVKVSPRLQGRIRQVFVRVGDHVTVGQTLAILDSIDAATAINTDRQNQNKLHLTQSTLERAERLYRLGTPEVTQAQANLEQARAHTAFTRDALNKLREQARIGGFTEKPLEDARNALVTANSALAQAQSDLAQAQRDHDRKVKLVDIGLASRSDLESSQNVLEKAQVNVQAGQEQVALARQAVEREQKAFKTNLYADQQVRSGENDYRQAQLQEEAAGTALRLAKAAVKTALEQAQSDYQAAQTDAQNSQYALNLLGHPDADGSMRILAPQSGVVTERNVNPGQIVDQSQETPWQMFTISNAKVVWVAADIYEKDIAAISLGAPVKIHVAAIPNQEFAGRVLHIAPTLDTKSRTVQVRAEIPNDKGLLRDGEYADVTILLSRGRQALMIPMAAVLHDGDSDYVYVLDGKKYRKRAVKLGAQRHDLCVVLSGLKPGEPVVTHGALFLGNQGNGD